MTIEQRIEMKVLRKLHPYKYWCRETTTGLEMPVECRPELEIGETIVANGWFTLGSYQVDNPSPLSLPYSATWHYNIWEVVSR